MNYLAHLYLSGDSEGILIGNFIGDAVKGKQYLNYRDDIQKGILLHRQIDSFTDKHPLVRECSHYFRPYYGRYSGIVTDVIFDHFLASGWASYSSSSLSSFADHVHAVLLSGFFRLPSKVQWVLPFFIKHRRLESYAQIEGIRQTLEIMGRRTSMPEESGFAIEVLQEQFHSMKEIFEIFFEELVSYVETISGIRIGTE